MPIPGNQLSSLRLQNQVRNLIDGKRYCEVSRKKNSKFCIYSYSPSMGRIMEHIDKTHLGACVTWERDGYPHFVLVKNEAFSRDETLRPILYRYDSKNFFFECQRVNSSGMWFVWVYVVDSIKVSFITYFGRY
jgi:hypothetical protein